MPGKKKILAITGGNGGAGTSFVAANLAALFARSGKKVIVADAWPGPSSLCHLLGVAPAGSPMKNYLENETTALESYFQKSPHVPVELFSGSIESPLYLTSPQTRRQLMRDIKKQNCDALVVDVPFGLSEESVESFLAAPERLLVVDSSPACLENAYAFLKAVAYKLLSKPFRKNKGVCEFIAEAMDPESGLGFDNMAKIGAALEDLDAGSAKKSGAYLAGFTPGIILNKTRSPNDEDAMPPFLKAVEKYLGIHGVYLSSLFYASEVWESVLRGVPVVLRNPDSRIAAELTALAGKLS